MSQITSIAIILLQFDMQSPPKVFVKSDHLYSFFIVTKLYITNIAFAADIFRLDFPR